MTPKWQKVASLAQEYAHSGFSSLVQSLLPKDTLLRTYSSLLRSSSKVILSDVLFIVLYSTQSSANRRIFDVMLLAISFM